MWPCSAGKGRLQQAGMTTPFIIAIDGPAASGKGSLARRLAAHLGFPHLDTGALYRRVGLDVLNAGGDPSDEAAALAAAKSLDPAMLNDPALKSDEAGTAASQASQYAAVRGALFDLQRDFVTDNATGAVLDGRDIGTVICPEAPVKLYVTASTEIRARRRFRELEGMGRTVHFDDVLADMQARDTRDAERAAAPMKPAPDAHILDTSDMGPDEVFHAALALINRARQSILDIK